MTLAERLREEGKKEGKKEGIETGETKALVNTTIKLLIKKFGMMPKEVKEEISKLDSLTLEVIIDDIFEYQSLEDVKKYIK